MLSHIEMSRICNLYMANDCMKYFTVSNWRKDEKITIVIDINKVI